MYDYGANWTPFAPITIITAPIIFKEIVMVMIDTVSKCQAAEQVFEITQCPAGRQVFEITQCLAGGQVFAITPFPAVETFTNFISWYQIGS